MGRIHRLDDGVVQRIAAGEVIQKPSNGVKELLENSLDAGATLITVQVQDGGYASLSIQDNGHGILREDLALLCERYATSKLRTIEDLGRMGTFGFRGEALASISHVSRMTVTTRTAECPVGYRANFIDGRLVGEPLAIAANVGTHLLIQDIFYNNPVRRVASSAARSDEYLRILEIVQRYAIEASGRVAFTCKRLGGGGGGGTDIATRLDSQKIDNIRLVHGDTVANALVEVSVGTLATGLISNAYFHQKTPVFTLFVNGRLVDCPRLKRAISGLYAEILMTRTHPFVHLSLSVDPEKVDVNVHPTKKHVVLLEEEAIVDVVAEACRLRLGESGVVKVFAPASRLASAARSSGGALPASYTLPTAAAATPRTLYPFQQVHTDHKTRTIDSFVYKKSKTDLSLSPLPSPSLPMSISSSLDGTTPPALLPAPQSVVEHGTRERNPFISKTAQSVPAKSKPAELGSGLDAAGSISEPSSISELKLHCREGAHQKITEVLQKHTLIGFLDARRLFVQFETALILVDFAAVLEDWCYQALLWGFGGIGRAPLAQPLPLAPCIRSFIESLPPEQIDPQELLGEVVEFVSEKRAVFEECFGICIRGCAGVEECGVAGETMGAAEIAELPALFEMPVAAGNLAFELGRFFFAAAVNVEWEDERACFASLMHGYAQLTSAWVLSAGGKEEKKKEEEGEKEEEEKRRFEYRAYVEHVVMDQLRRPPRGSAGYGRELASSGAVLQMATTHELYKIFERC